MIFDDITGEIELQPNRSCTLSQLANSCAKTIITRRPQVVYDSTTTIQCLFYTSGFYKVQ